MTGAWRLSVYESAPSGADAEMRAYQIEISGLEELDFSPDFALSKVFLPN